MTPPPGLAPSPAYRIYQGETVLGVVWSNAAVNMTSSWRVVYDDGDTETLILDRFTTGSSRAAQLISTSQVARKDGYVTEGETFADGAQRGQTYVVMYISQGYNPGDVRAPIAKGYVYASVPLALGQQIEPGPAGGHGAMTSISAAQPALGADYATQTVPTGALWKLRGFFAQLVTAATAANREFTIQFRDGVPNSIGGCVAGEVQTATLTDNYYGVGLAATAAGVSTALAGGAIQIGLGDIALSAGDSIFFQTFNIQAGDQWTGSARLRVEEWVMPN